MQSDLGTLNLRDHPFKLRTAKISSQTEYIYYEKHNSSSFVSTAMSLRVQ